MWPPPLSETPQEFEVKTRSDGKRIDSYLASRYTDYSRRVIQKVIDADAVLVNGRVVKASYRVRTGDVVSVRLPELPDTTPEPENIPIEVVYEDDALTVVNKPAGMVTHPAKGNWRGTMVNALQFHYDTLSTLGGENRPGIVHRLDRGTSGVLVVARTDSAHRSLAAQFRARTVKKIYLALVHGKLSRDSGTIDLPIARDPHRRTRMSARAAVRGRSAQTDWRVLAHLPGYTFVEIELHTGRTHQIRAHFSALGHPLAGDTLYGARKIPSATQWSRPAGALPPARPPDRPFLHAARLGFTHPVTGVAAEYRAPFPKDLADYLAHLAAASGIKPSVIDAAIRPYL